MMNVTLGKGPAVLAVAGHAGCGHCHSHQQFIQDDSGGLAAVLALFAEATGLSLKIKSIQFQTGIEGYFEVETVGGGFGKATARRGITLQEGRLAQVLVGREAILTQSLVTEAYGRCYGQGILEVPVALQTAIANAALDTFARNFPNQFISGYEDLEGSCGLIAGAILHFGNIPVAVLGTVNASLGGVGPNEDLEGNSTVGVKGAIMSQLGMTDLPTIVVEGKVYGPAYANLISEPTLLVRADPQTDNPFVADSLEQAARTLGYPVILRKDVMARRPGTMAELTRQLGEKITALGAQLQTAEYAQDKVNILAELACLISQDGGGISFMSNKLHDIIGGTGMIPGSGAVVSTIVPAAYHREFVVPCLTSEDCHRYTNLVKQTVQELHSRLPVATAHFMKQRFTDSLDVYVCKRNGTL